MVIILNIVVTRTVLDRIILFFRETMSIVTGVWSVVLLRSRVLHVRRVEDGWMVAQKTIKVMLCTEGEEEGELLVTRMWEVVHVGVGGETRTVVRNPF